MTLGNEFEFVRDPDLDPEIKKTLLEGLFEEKRSSRDAELKRAEVEKSRLLEQKRLWHNTPLMLALVGTVSVFANGLVAYIQGARTASDTVTLKQLEAQLRDSEQRSAAERERQVSQLKQQFTLEIAEAEAKRAASKEEREFAFKIVERQLSQDKSEAERAQILLFLVRAGVLSGLKEAELKMMAEASLRKEGPAIPSLVWTPDVRGAKSMLSRLGLYNGPINDENDAALRDALIAFQRSKNMDADGMLGPLTSFELRRAVQAPPVGNIPVAPRP